MLEQQLVVVTVIITISNNENNENNSVFSVQRPWQKTPAGRTPDPKRMPQPRGKPKLYSTKIEGVVLLLLVGL